MHHRDEVGRSVLQYSSRSLSKCSSDCISVHVNDVQKIKIKLCVEHYVCVCMCTLEQMPTTFFFISPVLTTSPVTIQTRRILLFFSSLLPLLTPPESCLLRFFFFFTLAHHQLGWPLVKKQHSGGGETMQMEERTRPGGPRCDLSAGESKKKKKTGERPPCENVSICE